MTIGLFDVFQDDNQKPKLQPLSSDGTGSSEEELSSQPDGGSSFEDIDNFDDTNSDQPDGSDDVQTIQGRGSDDFDSTQPMQPEDSEESNPESAEAESNASSQPKAQANPKQDVDSPDQDQNLNLNLDLEEFIPEGEDVDFDQYAEEIKETAQKGAKKNLRQQVKNGTKQSQIDLEGLKKDLTEEIKETARDIAPPEKEGIGQDFEDEEKPVEDDQKDPSSEEVETTRREEEHDGEEHDGEDQTNSSIREGVDDDGNALNAQVSRPSPPASTENIRRYDEVNDLLYVQKNACKRVVMNVKEAQNSLDILRERLSNIDTDGNPAENAKTIMSDVQRKLLDLESNLFEEDTL